MAHRTVAEGLVQTLIDVGVQRIYGVVGDSLNPITEAIRKTNGKLNWVHVRHEEAGAFAAGAEAQLTGRLAVCAGSCGPGHVHLINGLYDAHRSGALVLAIAAHIPSNEIGSQFFQETHPGQLFRECSHYNEVISCPQQAPRVLQMAMQQALGKGGVSADGRLPDAAAVPTPRQGGHLRQQCAGDGEAAPLRPRGRGGGHDRGECPPHLGVAARRPMGGPHPRLSVPTSGARARLKPSLAQSEAGLRRLRT